MSNYDPTRQEMLDFLTPLLGGSTEADEFDMEEAIYWYAHDYHGGQWSNLYSVLSTSPFKPGAYSTGLHDFSAALDLYTELCEKFGS
jgi:hypothetical protein